MLPDQKLQPDAALAPIDPAGGAQPNTDGATCTYCGATMTSGQAIYRGTKGSYDSMDCMGNNEAPPNTPVGQAQRQNDEFLP